MKLRISQVPGKNPPPHTHTYTHTKFKMARLISSCVDVSPPHQQQADFKCVRSIRNNGAFLKMSRGGCDASALKKPNCWASYPVMLRRVGLFLPPAWRVEPRFTAHVCLRSLRARPPSCPPGPSASHFHSRLCHHSAATNQNVARAAIFTPLSSLTLSDGRWRPDSDIIRRMYEIIGGSHLQ